MRRMTTLIIDDERLARQRLQRLLLQEPDVEVVGQCASVAEACDVISQRVPDVLFVDVQMPRAGGFELVRTMDPAHAPAIVFVTAYEQYAVEAFAVRACDYLLKPVADTRLKLAVQRAREAVKRRQAPDRLSEKPEAAHPIQANAQAPTDSVLIPSGAKVLRFHLDSIDWIEAAGNYVYLHIGGKAHLLRETMTAFESRLPAARFVRIHRTVIVNLDRVTEFQQAVSGDFCVTMEGGKQLRMSRTYRTRIRDLFGKSI